MGPGWTDSDPLVWLALTIEAPLGPGYVLLPFLLVSPSGAYSSNGSGAVQLVINIPTGGSICLTGKVDEAVLLEKNVNVFLQALY